MSTGVCSAVKLPCRQYLLSKEVVSVTQVNNAYTVLLREKKLPMALLEDPEAKAAAAGKAARASLVQTQPFAATFGAKHTRKRPKLAADSLADLVSTADRINATCAPAPAAWLTPYASCQRGIGSVARDRQCGQQCSLMCCAKATVLL